MTEDALLPVGTSLDAHHFVPGQFFDVTGITRGKGFQVNPFSAALKLDFSLVFFLHGIEQSWVMIT